VKGKWKEREKERKRRKRKEKTARESERGRKRGRGRKMVEGEGEGERKGEGEKGKDRRRLKKDSLRKVGRTDARTDTQVILYSVQCYALHWTDNKIKPKIKIELFYRINGIIRLILYVSHTYFTQILSWLHWQWRRGCRGKIVANFFLVVKLSSKNAKFGAENPHVGVLGKVRGEIKKLRSFYLLNRKIAIFCPARLVL